jgi:hypothetical protein
LLLMMLLLPLVLPRLLLLLPLLRMLLPRPLLLLLLSPPEGPLVLLVLLVLPLLRGPQGERNGDVVVCSRMSSTIGNMILDTKRRRRGRNTEAHSEQAGKRKGKREEQHGA